MSFLSNNSSIGLDISDYSLKACALTKKRGGIFVEEVAAMPVPKGLVDRGRILEEEAVVELIQKVLVTVQGGHKRNKFVNAVLPDMATFIKLIEVKKQDSHEELMEEIKKEASQHIPYALEDVYMDIQTIESEALERNSQEVLVGVCPQEVVDEYTGVLNKAGFIPKSLEVEALPVTRSIFSQERGRSSLSNRNIIVLDIGAARSSLIFWREQKYFNVDTIEFSVSLPLSGNGINSTIESTLGLKPDESEKFKRACGITEGGDGKGVLVKILEPKLKELVQKIHQSIDFHQTHFKGATIHKIFLCGAGSLLKGLDIYIHTETGLKVEYADPLINIKNKEKLNEEKAFSYATAVGLALKEFYT